MSKFKYSIRNKDGEVVPVVTVEVHENFDNDDARPKLLDLISQALAVALKVPRIVEYIE